MNRVLFFISLFFISCSSQKSEIEITNLILSDPKIPVKSIDLIDTTCQGLNNFSGLKIYLKQQDAYNNYPVYTGEFKFEKGYTFIFSKDDIQFIQKTKKHGFSWRNKLKEDKFTFVKKPFYATKEEERKATIDRIVKKRPLYYMSRAYFNKKRDKAVVEFHQVCEFCSPEYYFLVKENGQWLNIGHYINFPM